MRLWKCQDEWRHIQGKICKHAYTKTLSLLLSNISAIFAAVHITLPHQLLVALW